MLFPTVDFAVFFVIVFTGSWMLRPYHTVWRVFILASSCVFYVDFFDAAHNPGTAAFGPLVLFGAFAVVASFLIRLVSTSDEPGGDQRSLAIGVYAAIAGAFVVINVVIGRMLPANNEAFYKYLLLLLGFVLVNQAAARAVYASLGEGRARTVESRWVVRSAVAFDLLVLGVFKYIGWMIDAIHLPLDPLQIALPIAISFFTFQAIGYVVDVGRGEIRPISLLDFAVYLTFFAHVVAGPIVRVREFVPQLDEKTDPRYVEASEAFMLIFRGLFKKVVISSYIAAQIVDPVFASPVDYGRVSVLFAILGYAVQIYADFSGYTDIAIGVALLIGIRFPQNFDSPYRALSFQDFWRRWHMTLSRWLRDYLYIPLGGSRGTTGRTYFNLFMTMFLGGLWHGANGTFLIWGAIWGAALVVERMIKKSWAARGAIGLPPALVKTLQWLVTFSVVCFAWVFFRAPSAGEAIDVLRQLFSGVQSPDVAPVLTPLVVIVVVLAIASQFVPPSFPDRVAKSVSRVAPALQIVGFAVALMLIDALGPEGIAPFIYFQF
jgi:D-alanyl-lipoteichoic acid acyltransferase DltB (MBOAT superfamily)